MRNDFINISSKDKQYPMYITSIEVDKIINALLGKAYMSIMTNLSSKKERRRVGPILPTENIAL